MFPSVGNIIFGLCGIGGGFYVLTNAYFLNHQIYFLQFAERKWGPGAGTLAYRFIGISLMIFSMFVLAGVIDLFNTGTSSTTTQQAPTATTIPKSSNGIQIAP